MKKLLLSFFLLISFSLVLNAQEKENPKFNLLGNTFSNELKFEAIPVGSEKIHVYIYPDVEDKASLINPTQLMKSFIINRGNQKILISLESLPIGKYNFLILNEKKQKVFTDKFIKE